MADRQSFLSTSNKPANTTDPTGGRSKRTPLSKLDDLDKSVDQFRERTPSRGKSGFSNRATNLTEKQIREAKVAPVGERKVKVEEAMKVIVEAHMNTSNYTSEAVQRGFKTYEIITLNQLNAFDVPELRKVTEMPEPKKIWHLFTESMASAIKRVVAFAKLLPGFTELYKEDQMTLFKQGSFEVILARYTKLFTEQGMFVPDMTIRIPRQLISLMPLGDLFEEQYKFADTFNQLGLTDAETGLVTAVMLVNSERTGLHTRKEVQKLNSFYLQTLYTYLKETHPDTFDDFFTRIIHTFPISAQVNDSHGKKMHTIKNSNPVDLKFSDIHNEVFE